MVAELGVNGPQHYREAERLLDGLAAIGDDLANLNGVTADVALASLQFMAAQAQVHATLALAAAQAGVLMREHLEGEDDANAWAKATQ